MSDNKEIKIANAFDNGKAFIGFLTAGDPTIEKTVEYVLAMEEAGCDLVEIGIPFSDPVAEGPVIQEANIRALKNNTNTDDVFEAIRQIREKSNVPLVFLTYINPVFYYGYEKFFKKCKELNVCGIISPDLPYDEKDEILDVASRNDVDFGINTPEQAKNIAKVADGVIVGSAIVNIIGEHGENAREPLVNYVRSMKDAILSSIL